MAKHSTVELIEAYRKRQGSRSLFTIGNISQALLFLFILAATIYISLNGGPTLPVLVDLKTNTPTYTPSITPTPTQTFTVTPTPTETPDPEDQCNCTASTVVVFITATFSASDNTPLPLPSPTETATISPYTATITFTPTNTLPPAPSATPTQSMTPTASITPTPTEVMYTVKSGDTLSYIAFSFGVTIETIQALNNLESTTIYEGQVLQIPRP